MISVLYVDDEATLLELGKCYLEKDTRFFIDTAHSAPQALEKMRSWTYDAVVSDYQMPEMNGIEFLKRIRSSGNTIPFIIFTGKGREEVVIQALNEGADYYLQKGGEPKSQFTELKHKICQAVQQRRAETHIRDLERRETDIINFLPDATFAIDTRGVVIAWNHAMEKLTEIRAAEILGKGDYAYAVPFYRNRRPILIDLVLHEDLDIAANYPFIVREGKNLISENTIPHFNDGKGASIWFIASPLYDNRGTVVGAIESIRDITAQKVAEEALRESEERYRAVVEDQTEFICRFRPDGTHFFVNEAYCRYFHKQRSEIIGKRFMPPVPPEDREELRQHFASLTADHPVAEVRHRIIMPDGQVRWQRWSDRAIFGPGGGVTEYQSVGRDITDVMETDMALRGANEHLENLIRHAGTPIIAWDGSFLITEFNDAAESLTGLSRDEIVGKDLGVLFSGDARKKIPDAVRSTEESSGSVTIGLPVPSVPSGSVRLLQWELAAVPGPEKIVVATLALGQDTGGHLKRGRSGQKKM